MAHILERFVRLPPTRRRLVVEAALLLSLARIAVATVPFRWIARILGEQGAEAVGTPDRDQRNAVLNVSWAIRAVNRQRPFRCKCLVEAITGQVMLIRRKIPSTFYLGVARSEDGLKAHAWVQVGESHVPPSRGEDGFKVLSSFARPGPSEGMPPGRGRQGGE